MTARLFMGTIVRVTPPRASRYAGDAMLAIVSAVLMWSLFQRGLDPAWSGHLRTDCTAFQARATEFLSDHSWSGLRDNEYQPGALWFFAGVGALNLRGSFVETLMAVNALLLLSHVLLARMVRGSGQAWAMVAIIAGVGPILLYRFEAVVSLLVICGVLMGGAKPPLNTIGAGTLMGIGVATKLYPVLLLPGLLASSLTKGARQAALAAGGAVVVGVTIPTLLLSSFGYPLRQMVAAVAYHLDKPVGVDGFWGSAFPVIWGLFDFPLKMASRNAIHGFDPALPGMPAWAAQALTWMWVPLIAVFIAVAGRRRGWAQLNSPGVAFVIIGLYVAFNKLYTPQYCWWALPFMVLAPRGWFTPGERATLFVTLAGCLAISQLIFPLNYSAFLATFQTGTYLNSWLFWANAGKNLLWVAAVGVGARAACRHQLTQPALDSACNRE